MHAPGDRPDRESGPLRILIVEDDPGVRDVLVETLSTCRGIECGTAATFQEAVTRLQEREYGALIVDCRLRCSSGLDLFRHLEAAGSQLCKRIVFISGYLEEAEMEEVCRLTGNLFVRKPFGQEQILEAVDIVLGREANPGPTVAEAAAAEDAARRERPGA